MAEGPSTTAGVAPRSDWPAEAADTVVRAVDTVNQKVLVPAQTAARAIVYGFLAAVVGIICLVLVAIVTVRLLVAYLPDDVVGEDHVWAAHLIVGVVFGVAGLFCWAKRRSSA